MPVARLDAVEAGMEVRALQVAGRAVHLVEEIGPEDGLVDHEALRRRPAAAPRLVGEKTHFDAGATLWRGHRLAASAHRHRHPVQHECLHDAEAIAVSARPEEDSRATDVQGVPCSYR